MAREMQTLVVSKEVAGTRSDAETVHRRVRRREPRTVRETDESWRFAQFPPDQCEANSYASQEIIDGVTAVYCERRRPRG
jgi:hypothetical protein